MTSRHGRQVAALAALASLLGPFRAYIVPPAIDALARHELLAEAIASFIAGLALLAAASNQPRSDDPQRGRAIWLLLLPQLLATSFRTHSCPSHPSTTCPGPEGQRSPSPRRSGSPCSPAAQITSTEVPRLVAGVAILAASTVLLTVETSAYTITPNQIPALILALSLAILTIYTWSYAAQRLGREAAARSAATFLLLRAAMDTLFSVTLERTSLHDVVWRDALPLLCLYAALTAATMFLWFWLLKHAALRLRPASLAVWTASILGGLVVFGLSNWRMDAAVAHSARRTLVRPARTSLDEQPVALELR